MNLDGDVVGRLEMKRILKYCDEKRLICAEKDNSIDTSDNNSNKKLYDLMIDGVLDLEEDIKNFKERILILTSKLEVIEKDGSKCPMDMRHLSAN